MNGEQEQVCRDHLARANHVRTTRAQIHREIADGRRSVADVLADPPPELAGVAVGRLLTWVHGIGWHRAGRLTSGITTMTLTVGDLGEHSRLRLLARLDDEGH